MGQLLDDYQPTQDEQYRDILEEDEVEEDKIFDDVKERQFKNSTKAQLIRKYKARGWPKRNIILKVENELKRMARDGEKAARKGQSKYLKKFRVVQPRRGTS